MWSNAGTVILDRTEPNPDAPRNRWPSSESRVTNSLYDDEEFSQPMKRLSGMSNPAVARALMLMFSRDLKCRRFGQTDHAAFGGTVEPVVGDARDAAGN